VVWTVDSECAEVLGYKLRVYRYDSDVHPYQWSVDVDDHNKRGLACGHAQTREKAMAAAEEAVRCLDKHSP